MDLKTHILRWQHAIAENNAILILAIIILLAAVFLIALLVDAILKARRDNKRARRRK